MSQSSRSYHGGMLTLIFLLLTVIGLANLYSAGAESLYFDSQFKRMFIGLFCYVLFGWFIPIKHVNSYAYVYFGVVFVALLVVLVLGHTAGGAQRWLILGPLRIQPSEFAKLAIAIVVAKFFYHHRTQHVYTLYDIWPILAVICSVFMIIFKQPDFGTAGICFLISMCQLAFIRS